MESSINAKGQVTIPKTILAHLGIEPGDRVKFFVHLDGGIVLLPMLPASALRGFVTPQVGAVTIEEMTEAIVAGTTDGAGLR
jgi:antitoxin PrlF